MIKNPQYALGEITSYARGTHTTVAWYKFIANNVEYRNNSSYHLPYRDLKPGEKFIVIYNSANPKVCVMDYDYPIKDSADYKKYIDEFKTTPPKSPRSL